MSGQMDMFDFMVLMLKNNLLENELLNVLNKMLWLDQIGWE